MTDFALLLSAGFWVAVGAGCVVSAGYCFWRLLRAYEVSDLPPLENGRKHDGWGRW